MFKLKGMLKMRSRLLKNIAFEIALCIAISIFALALFAETDAYNDGIMLAHLTATKNPFGDSCSAYTAEVVDPHNCTEYNDYIYVKLEYKVGDVPEFFLPYRENHAYVDNYVSISYNPGFGNDLKYAVSEHSAEVYCENCSSSTSLSATAS